MPWTLSRVSVHRRHGLCAGRLRSVGSCTSGRPCTWGCDPSVSVTPCARVCGLVCPCVRVRPCVPLCSCAHVSVPECLVFLCVRGRSCARVNQISECVSHGPPSMWGPVHRWVSLTTCVSVSAQVSVSLRPCVQCVCLCVFTGLDGSACASVFSLTLCGSLRTLGRRRTGEVGGTKRRQTVVLGVGWRSPSPGMKTLEEPSTLVAPLGAGVGRPSARVHVSSHLLLEESSAVWSASSAHSAVGLRPPLPLLRRRGLPLPDTSDLLHPRRPSTQWRGSRRGRGVTCPCLCVRSCVSLLFPPSLGVWGLSVCACPVLCACLYGCPSVCVLTSVSCLSVCVPVCLCPWC